MRRIVLSLSLVLLGSAPLAGQSGRPLALEDYYRANTVGSPRISPTGDWVTYTVSTRIEDTNETETESWVVRADGSAPPTRVERDGGNVANPRWAPDGRLRVDQDDATWLIDPTRPTSGADRDESVRSEGVPGPNGDWLVLTQEMPLPTRPERNLTAFESRHEERFEGVQFDWYPFRRDGRAFPLPDPDERPLTEIFPHACGRRRRPAAAHTAGPASRRRPVEPRWARHSLHRRRGGEGRARLRAFGPLPGCP